MEHFLRTVQAAGLIRTLQTKDRPTKLARADPIALGELQPLRDPAIVDDES